MSDECSVTAYFDPDEDAYEIKIGHDKFEVNVVVPKSEIDLFSRVRDARWDARGSIRIGTIFDSAVFWCSDPQTRDVSLLVGHDDETWQLALTLPSNLVELILAAIEEETPRAGAT